MSQAAKEAVIHSIYRKKNLLLCAATGNSPLRMYKLLAAEYCEKPDLFAEMRLIKLDEWAGMAMSDSSSCEYYLQENLIGRLKIPAERYISFDSAAGDPAGECVRVQRQLAEQGPVDLCVLGVGVNGHLALNEPADALQRGCHVASLSSETMKHAMLAQRQSLPTQGFTLGVEDIMQSREILLLVGGRSKRDIVRRLMSEQISTGLPASLLRLHRNARCLITQDAAG